MHKWKQFFEFTVNINLIFIADCGALTEIKSIPKGAESVPMSSGKESVQYVATDKPNRSKKRRESYSIRTYNLLKKVHSETGVSKATKIMKPFVSDLFRENCQQIGETGKEPEHEQVGFTKYPNSCSTTATG